MAQYSLIMFPSSLGIAPPCSNSLFLAKWHKPFCATIPTTSNSSLNLFFYRHCFISFDCGSGRVGSGRVGSGRVGSGRVGSGRVGSGRVGSGRVGFGRVGSGRVGSGRVGSGRVGSGRVWVVVVLSREGGEGEGERGRWSGMLVVGGCDADALRFALKKLRPLIQEPSQQGDMSGAITRKPLSPRKMCS